MQSEATQETGRKNILVTGGAGYIGSILVPKLLRLGHHVTVMDLFAFGDQVFNSVPFSENLTQTRADIRDQLEVESLLHRGAFDVVIHLAAISNDPSSDLAPDLTRSVNRDALEHVMTTAKRVGVPRFLYASSASVYGVKDTPNVTEDLPLDPMTLYAKYKAEGEGVLNSLIDDHFCGASVRAATVCGFSPRLRLDLTINILTTQALTQGGIRVFGGNQMRPNIHIQDLTDFYILLMHAPVDIVNGRAFNVVSRNFSVMELAQMVQSTLNPELPISVVPTNDHRSYHLSGSRANVELGYAPTHPLTLACEELRSAFSDGRISDPTAAVYRNVEWMKLHPDYIPMPARS